MTVAIIAVPSVTRLPAEADGAVVVGGSHGAVYAAYLSAKAGVRAAIHNDAGIGRDDPVIGVHGCEATPRERYQQRVTTLAALRGRGL